MTTMTTCPGCFPEFQPNQTAHMCFGGCMDSQYDEISLLESEEESVWTSVNEDGEEACFMGIAPLNLNEEFASASEAEVTSEVFCAPCGNECAICMDDIGTNNCTVTECGHRFHSSCIFRNMIERIECPMCRKDLVDMPAPQGAFIHVEEYTDDDEEEYEESVDEEEGDEEEEQERDVTCKQMADKLQSLGYTMADILYFAIGRCHSSEAARLNNELDERIGDLVERMLDGELGVDHRDGRTYAEVLASQQAPAQPQQVPPQSQQVPPQSQAQAEPKSPRRRRPDSFEPLPSLEAI